MTLRLTREEARALGIDEAGKRHKFGAETDKNLLTMDGFVFKSKLEISRYAQLKQMERAKRIHSLKVKPVFPIMINETRVCDVELDFAYTQDAVRIYEDAKGCDNALSRLKRKMVEAAYGIKVNLPRAQRKGWAR